MKRNFLILAALTLFTTSGITYGVTAIRTDCPLEGTSACPKENCPLKGTALCPYEDNTVTMASTVKDCCKKR